MPSSRIAAVPTAAGHRARSENLALCFQELLTVIVRLRSNRQSVSDPNPFRSHVKQALASAENQARRLGYSPEDTRQAVFAVVALLDESILNSANPVFADWPRKPLQEELFGVHVAGEVFFRSLEQVLSRDDSAVLADLLEVNYLCLLLGYGGRYGAGAIGDRQSLTERVGRRLYHIRESLQGSGPSWALPDEPTARPPRDIWVRRLSMGALVCGAVFVVAFVFYWFSLDSGAAALRNLAERPTMQDLS